MFNHITSDSAVLGGKPCIKGTRISVAMILEWVASGASRDEIVKSYPQLTAEDVDHSLNFAAASHQVTLTELLKRVSNTNIHHEWGTGPAIGNEAW